MLNKIFKNFSIMSFAKLMAIVLVIVATSNFMFAIAADATTSGLSWDSIRTSVIQWLIGIFMGSLTVIIGYVANLLRYAITCAYDAIRAYIANTQILEVLADLKDFCLNETATVENMANEALKNDNKIDDAELKAIANKVVSDAMAVWGEKKIAYLEKYRPMLKDWLIVKAKAIIQNMVESFRARKSSTTAVVNK